MEAKAIFAFEVLEEQAVLLFSQALDVATAEALVDASAFAEEPVLSAILAEENKLFVVEVPFFVDLELLAC